LVAEAEPREHARTKVLHHDIDARRDTIEDRFCLGRLQVDGDRAFVAVPRQKVGALASAQPSVVERHGAKQVALARTFDLDHGGHEIAQHLGGEWSLKQVAEVEHGDAVQSLLHRFHSLTWRATNSLTRAFPPGLSKRSCKTSPSWSSPASSGSS